MPTLLNVDHKFIAIPVFAATAALAVYSTGRLWAMKRKQKKENVYETANQLNNYLLLHYGSASETMQWDFGPKSDLEFPKRCADLCLKYWKAKPSEPSRALDVGCAVGRSTFELARNFDEVIGIDYSKSFTDTCNLLKEKGYLKYSVTTQGELTQDLDAVVDKSINRRKVTFQRGDACSLPLDIGEFGCVLAANLVCRLHSPNDFLDRLPNLVAHAGILVITSPYTFSTQYTPRDNWIGGWRAKDDKPRTGFDGLKEKLDPFFELLTTEEIPLVIRETERKYQWIVSHATVWRRK